MANFNETINLMGFRGAMRAQMPSPLVGGKVVTGTFIPDAWNDVRVETAYGEAGQRGEVVANVRLYMEGYSQQYMEKSRQNRLMSGEDMEKWQPASHRVQVKFSEQTEKRAREQLVPKIVAEHPEWQANPDLQNPDVNKELRYALRDRMRVAVGKAYAIVARDDRQQFAQQPVQPVAQAQQYEQPLDPVTGQPLQTYSPEDDDLPF